MSIDITIPERVWLDYLDPLASEMQATLGLGEPDRLKRGRGASMRYERVSANVAAELAEYLHDRGETLLAQRVTDPYDPFEKADRDTLRAGIRVAATIREQLKS